MELDDLRVKCPHCPVVGPAACHGESTPRMCQLTDPGHPDHDARYGPLLVDMAARGPAYPPLAQQAANLAGSLWAWAVSGFTMASEDERARRIAICESCEFFDPGLRRCKHMGCGCYLDAKTKMRTEHCPIAKW